MLSKSYSIIIDCSVSAPRHVREVVDGINATDKSFPSHLIASDQLNGSKDYDTHMVMQYATKNSDVSLA